MGSPMYGDDIFGDKKNVSAGLTKEEAAFLQSKGTQVLLIYNQFTDATGYQNGVNQANLAIQLAIELGVPEKVYIFADIEQNYPVDMDFILGWSYTLWSSPYHPGIYGNVVEGEKITTALNGAIEKEGAIKEKVIIWTNQPQIGVTTQKQAPPFEPATPTASPNVLVWLGASLASIGNPEGTGALPARFSPWKVRTGAVDGFFTSSGRAGKAGVRI